MCAMSWPWLPVSTSCTSTIPIFWRRWPCILPGPRRGSCSIGTAPSSAKRVCWPWCGRWKPGCAAGPIWSSAPQPCISRVRTGPGNLPAREPWSLFAWTPPWPPRTRPTLPLWPPSGSAWASGASFSPWAGWCRTKALTCWWKRPDTCPTTRWWSSAAAGRWPDRLAGASRPLAWAGG